ncbi:MAG: hypothetical protein JWM20_527 [Patescibacteria group bacterium]|nr:hypothetical protein [Patescibacteria group bacterium]
MEKHQGITQIAFSDKMYVKLNEYGLRRIAEHWSKRLASLKSSRNLSHDNDDQYDLMINRSARSHRFLGSYGWYWFTLREIIDIFGWDELNCQHFEDYVIRTVPPAVKKSPDKRVIILEGVSTSGKTSVAEKIKVHFDEKRWRCMIVNEEETLMPIINNSNQEKASQHLEILLKEYLEANVDVLIFERLHLTHAYRTGTQDLKKGFGACEKLLKKYWTKLCFLEVPESNISKRISSAMLHRKNNWVNYWELRERTPEEISNYYFKQQQQMREVLAQSNLSSMTFDTQNMDFERIADDIANSASSKA